MARPAMRDPTGRWSLSQVASAAGITPRTARTIATNGYLGDPETFTAKTVVSARVAAHLLDAPRAPRLSRDQAADLATQRNFEALALTRRVIDDPTPKPETVLLVSPTTVVLHTSQIQVLAHLEGTTDPVLILPVGVWVVEANTALLDGTRVAS